jgi:hypothetical protein
MLEQDGAGYELAGHLGPRPAERLDAAARRPLLHRLLSTRQPVTLDQLEREHDALTAPRGTAAELETLDAIARSLVELHAGAVIGILAVRPPLDAQRRSTASGAIPRVVDDTALVPCETILGLLCIRDERSRDAFASAELALAYIDYPKRMLGVCAHIRLSGDMEADLALIAEHLKAHHGKCPELASPIRLNH